MAVSLTIVYEYIYCVLRPLISLKALFQYSLYATTIGPSSLRSRGVASPVENHPMRLSCECKSTYFRNRQPPLNPPSVAGEGTCKRTRHRSRHESAERTAPCSPIRCTCCFRKRFRNPHLQRSRLRRQGRRRRTRHSRPSDGH